MKLLDIHIPPMARTQWVSSTAKNEWQSRVWKAQKCYHKLEIETIRAGLRRCTTAHLRSDHLAEDMRMWAQRGLTALPTTQIGMYNGFAHAHPPVVEGQPWQWYAPVGATAADAEAFAHASDIGDHRAIGDLLGYPKCCQDFFTEVWGAGYVDPVWHAAENTDENYIRSSLKTEKSRTLRLKKSVNHGLFQGLRYVGIRLAPHLTCSNTCEPSSQLVRDWTQVAVDAKLEGLEDLMYLLQMPVRWSCLKGIAIVDTPIFRIVTNSMPCFPEYVVEKEGTYVPKEAVKALRFPWLPAPRTYGDLVDIV